MDNMKNAFGIDLEGSELFSEVRESPVPCLILNKGLPPGVLAQMTTMFEIVDITDDDGEHYFGIRLGFYMPPKPGEPVRAMVLDPWGNHNESEEV